MATPTNHWKLGLFVVGSVVLGLATVVVLGARSLQRETISYKTYFDESVQGLDVGSPVKFRGVVIGNTSRIDIAPDRRHVEITSDLEVPEIVRLGLATGSGRKIKIQVPADLRMQLASAGITGVKFLQIDFFPVEDNPPPKLPFPEPPNYIPAAVSVMKNLEDSVVRAVNRIPDVADEILTMTKKVNQVIDQLEGAKVPAQAERILAKTEQLVGQIDRSVADIKTGAVSEQVRETLTNVNGAVTRLNTVIDRATGKDGVYASAQRASDALGDVARNATGLEMEVEDTLRSVRAAADSLSKLTDALETDSDMLIKGRSRRTP